MAGPLRLASISAALADSFLEADDEQRQQATFATCMIALAQADLQEDEISEAVDFLRDGRGDREAVQAKLNALVACFDQNYLELSENAAGNTPGALRLFRKARAASALAFALSSDPRQLHEAIYEAIVACEDKAEVIQATDAILSGRLH